MGGFDRAIVVLGGLAGLAGVALSALAAHVAGPGNLDTAARFLLVHAPALIALAAAMRTGLCHRLPGRLAAAALVLGLILFCGDLTVRTLYGIAPLRLAAPVGGVLLMAGWLMVTLGAILPARVGPA